MDISVSSEERELLLEVLEERQRVMLREISRARHHDFRDTLKRSETLLEGLIIRLRSVHPEDVAGRVA